MPLDHTRLDNPDVDTRRRPVLRVDGPAALVQAVPYLVGFQPNRSLVLVGLDDGVLVVTARLDLGGPQRDPDLSHALDVLQDAGVGEVVVVVFDDAAPANDPDWAPALDRLTSIAAQSGLGIVDVLMVASGRWWSLSCGDAACCPADGRPVEAQTSAFAAAATYAGMVVHRDRDALAAILDPFSQSARDELAPLLADAEVAAVRTVLAGGGARRVRSVKRALFAAARRAELIDPEIPELDVDQLLRFGIALREIAIRDAVWMAVDDGRLDGRRLWAELARRLPSPYDAAPSFLFGWSAWRAGNGALAGIAARRSIESDPAYSASDLLLAAVSRGIDPRRMPKLRIPR